MYGVFENRRVADLVFASTLLVLIGANTPLVFGGEDVSLSEVPQAVRATIEHETKGFEIDDIERDKDDGMIVYEVDAEDDDREIKLKIAEDGTLLRKEQEIDEDDLPAAVLAAVKKAVGDMDFDDVEIRFRKGRGTIYKIEGDKDELEIDLEIAEDGTIVDKEIKRKDDDDLPDDFRDQRRLFLKLRGQLKVAAVGDSRVEKGIDPKYFLGEENKKYPMALNFGAGGSGLPRVRVIIEDYLVHAPKLQWAVYGISPRVFNKYYRSDEGDDIKRSSLYRSDKQRQDWSEITGELVPASAIDDDDFSPWGFDGEDGMEDELEDEDDREDFREDLREKGRYQFDTKRLEVFESLIQILAKRNVEMLAFTPPMHPISAGLPCTDDDGTPREAYDELVEKMKALDKKHANFYFIDVNNKGEHNLEHKDFNNFDHLNKKGAKKLTLMLNDFMKAVDSKRKENIGKEQPQQ